jgi:hypothetical protein
LLVPASRLDAELEAAVVAPPAAVAREADTRQDKHRCH